MKRVAVIGAGPAGLMAAEVLSDGGAQVTVYDRMASAGRKFLMAGRGGLNLTHSEALDRFLARYGDAPDLLRDAIERFRPTRLRAWSEALGQPTFVGSSGRVFPRAMKASPLLRAWLRRLDARAVHFALRHHWIGWGDEGRLAFEAPDGAVAIEPTRPCWHSAARAGRGSVGRRMGGRLDPGRCRDRAAAAVQLRLPGRLVGAFRTVCAGQQLKRLALSFGDHAVRGEAIITAAGLEGGAIYALSGPLRDAIAAHGEATLRIALRPDLKDIESRLGVARGKQSISTFLRKALSLSPAEIGLLQEATGGKLSTSTAAELARLINALPVRLTGVAPLARAISTAGGVAFDTIDARFMLRGHPGVFVAGEMLDWEAPTGGYLLQACFATGAAAGRGALEWLA